MGGREFLWFTLADWVAANADRVRLLRVPGRKVDGRNWICWPDGSATKFPADDACNAIAPTATQ